jgi:hypothetical protein
MVLVLGGKKRHGTMESDSQAVIETRMRGEMLCRMKRHSELMENTVGLVGSLQGGQHNVSAC